MIKSGFGLEAFHFVGRVSLIGFDLAAPCVCLAFTLRRVSPIMQKMRAK